MFWHPLPVTKHVHADLAPAVVHDGIQTLDSHPTCANDLVDGSSANDTHIDGYAVLGNDTRMTIAHAYTRGDLPIAHSQPGENALSYLIIYKSLPSVPGK